jgi:ribonuclease HII
VSLSKIQNSTKEFIIGADEVGYGCWAGPLVVCGVKAPKGWNLIGLNDSKKLSEGKRATLYAQLLKLNEEKEISFHIAERSNTHIDKVGLGVALKESYVEIFKTLYTPKCLIISDGILKFDNLGVDDYDMVSLIKADTQIPTVMAGSILAKHYRDTVMKVHHNSYPEYDWENNVGYGVKKHKEAIRKHGFTPLHRMSYNIKL